MTTATEYRQYAQECIQSARDARILAGHTDVEGARVMLEHIANTWDRVAERLRREIKLGRLARLEGFEHFDNVLHFPKPIHTL